MRDGQASTLRVAVIGYGLGGASFHAPLIAATAGMRVAAVVTRDAGRAAAARTRYPDADVIADVERLWTRAAELDLVVIATPNRTHVPLALEALEAGLHVVVDKPLAVSSRDAGRVIEEARHRARVLSVFQNRRWDADFLTLRRLLAENALGEVFRFESRYERWRLSAKPGWRQEPLPDEGGGILYDLGAHLIDQALVLFGPVREVYAQLDRRRPGARVDDDAFLALTHEGGVRSHLWMNVITAGNAPRFHVLGARATWTKHGLDVQEERLRAGGDPREAGFGVEPEDRWGVLADGEGIRRTPSAPGSYADFYAGIARAIRDSAPPPVDAADSIAVLEIIETAHGRAPA